MRWQYRIAFLICTLFVTITCWAQRPEINSINKISGPTGDVVVIGGTSFGTNASNIVVSFGATNGSILSITNQRLEVAIPAGTTFQTITVTNTSAGLSGYSSIPFLLSYSGESPINPSNFETQVNFNAGIDAFNVCLCDLDNDGKTDIIAVNKKDNNITVLRNTSTGTGNIGFSKVDIALGFFGINVKCGDLNGDGKKDLVITQESSTGNNVAFLRNTSSVGSISFSITTLTLAGHKNAVVFIADVDVNGKPDILISDEGSNRITILKNESTSSTLNFSSAPIIIDVPSALSTDGLFVHDMNSDGLPEIITTQYQTGNSNLYIIRNQSTPENIQFGTTTTITIGNSIKRIGIADIDGDGKPDIAVTQQLAGLSVLLNTNTGSSISFSSPKPVATEALPFGLDFGDLDGDGKVDLVVSSVSVARLTLLNNQSTPGNVLLTKTIITTSFAGRDVRIGDVDGDGKPDIVYSGIDANNPTRIAVLRNKACVLPKITPADSPLALCSGILPYTLSATNSPGSYYQWLKNGVPIPSECGLNKTSLNITSTLGSGIYSVKIISEGGDCSSLTGCVLESNTVEITVMAGSASNTNPQNNGPICLGSTLNLSLGNPIGGATYHWTGPDGWTATGATPSRTNLQPSQAGTYSVDVVVGGCIAKKEQTIVSIIDVPSFNINSAATNVLCEGDPAKTLAITPSPATFTYEWFKNGISHGTGTSISLPSTSSSNGSYTVKASYAGCATIETSPVIVKVTTPPAVGFTNLPQACAGQKVTFTNTTVTDPTLTPQFAWTFGDGGTSTLQHPEHIYTSNNTYTINLTAGYNGACQASATHTIEITPAASVSIINSSNEYEFCEGNTLTLEVAGTYSSYQWSNGATTPTIQVSMGGSYTVEVSTGSCLITSAPRNVVMHAKPSLIASASPTLIQEGESSQLEAFGTTTYLWLPSETLDNASISNPIATPLTTTLYTVSGENDEGCSATATVEVRVKGESITSKLILPNIITPNGDNQNDLWEIDGILLYPQCEVIIFDDKGVKVFSAKPYLNDWNGQSKGKELVSGAYYYIIRCDGEESTPKTGSITLLR
jgi:gliding motility-associated-like protein